MKTNEGNLDRILRVVLALVAVSIGATQPVPATLAIVLYAVAGVLTLTALVGFCPLYAILGIRTCPIKPSPKSK